MAATAAIMAWDQLFAMEPDDTSLFPSCTPSALERALQQPLAQIPRDPTTWFLDDVNDIHPHKLFYSFDRTFTKDFKKAVADTVRCIETHAPITLLPVTFPAANKCVKCNRFFYSKEGRAVRPIAVRACGCQTTVYADKCIKCIVLQWLLAVVSPGKKKTPVAAWKHVQFERLPTIACRCKTVAWSPASLHRIVAPTAAPPLL
jgi:hypothetical protein